MEVAVRGDSCTSAMTERVTAKRVSAKSTIQFLLFVPIEKKKWTEKKKGEHFDKQWTLFKACYSLPHVHNVASAEFPTQLGYSKHS